MKEFSARVRLLSDGNRTVAEARLLELGEIGIAVREVTTGIGSSGREPGDKANSEVGEKLALVRALRSMAAHLESQAQGRIRHIESNKQHKAEIADRKEQTAKVSLATPFSLDKNGYPKFAQGGLVPNDPYAQRGF